MLLRNYKVDASKMNTQQLVDNLTICGKRSVLYHTLHIVVLDAIIRQRHLRTKDIWYRNSRVQLISILMKDDEKWSTKCDEVDYKGLDKNITDDNVRVELIMRNFDLSTFEYATMEEVKNIILTDVAREFCLNK